MPRTPTPTPATRCGSIAAMGSGHRHAFSARFALATATATATATAAIALALAATATLAHAEPVSTEIVKQSVTALTEPIRDIDPPTPEERASVVAGLATPFHYDGLTYGTLDPAAAKRCKKTFKRSGTITSPAKLPAFVDCLQIAMFSGALDPDADWTPVDLAKLPRVYKKHRSKLTKLAKSDAHTLVMSHFIPAGPAEHYDLWIVKHEPSGALKLAGLLVVNLQDAP
jgi:hypothetical protein